MQHRSLASQSLDGVDSCFIIRVKEVEPLASRIQAPIVIAAGEIDSTATVIDLDRSPLTLKEQAKCSNARLKPGGRPMKSHPPKPPFAVLFQP